MARESMTASASEGTGSDRGPRTDEGPAEEDGTGTITWWVLLVLGLIIIAYGVRGLVDGLATARLLKWAGWFAGGLLVHDLVAVPLYTTLGLGARRVLPRAWTAPVQVGAILTAVIALPTWPVLRGYGRSAQEGNPTILPFDYATNLAVVVGIIWIGVLLAGVWVSRDAGRAPTEADMPIVREDADAADDPLAGLDFEIDSAMGHDEADDRELVRMSDVDAAGEEDGPVDAAPGADDDAATSERGSRPPEEGAGQGPGPA